MVYILHYNFVFKQEMCNYILMEKVLRETDTLKEFLGEIASIYNSPHGFPKLEDFAKQYREEYKKELSEIMKHIYSVNTGGSSRILGLDVSDLEQILKKAIHKQS